MSNEVSRRKNFEDGAIDGLQNEALNPELVA